MKPKIPDNSGSIFPKINLLLTMDGSFLFRIGKDVPDVIQRA